MRRDSQTRMQMPEDVDLEASAVVDVDAEVYESLTGG